MDAWMGLQIEVLLLILYSFCPNVEQKGEFVILRRVSILQVYNTELQDLVYGLWYYPVQHKSKIFEKATECRLHD